VLSNLPVAVAGFALTAWCREQGIYATDFAATDLLNPVNYLFNVFRHAGCGHFAGNMRLWYRSGSS
jgi:hypothetical protein